jgi:putative transposase
MLLLCSAKTRSVRCLTLAHYNGARPHSALGPGIPDPPAMAALPAKQSSWRLGRQLTVVTRPVLGGLHHEYAFVAATG